MPSFFTLASTATFHGASLFVRVRIWKCFTAAVSSSPQVPPDATATLAMSTVEASLTVALRGPFTPLLPLFTESDGHPVPVLVSNAPLAFVPQNGA